MRLIDADAKYHEKDLAEDYRMVLHEAKSMGCNEIRALYNIPLKNMEMIVQALEKQIPKKPIFANNMMTKDKFLMCPCCEFRFPDSLVFLKTRCWNCGQKLDWSDEE